MVSRFSSIAGNIIQYMFMLKEMGGARFDLEGRNFVLKEHSGIKAGDLRRIKEAVDVNKDVIIDFWKKIFESDDEDSENLVR